MRVAEELLTIEQGISVHAGRRGRDLREVCQANQVLLYPLLVWLALRKRCLDIGIAKQNPMLQVNSNHLTWSESTLFDHFMCIARYNSRLGCQDQQSIRCQCIASGT